MELVERCKECCREIESEDERIQKKFEKVNEIALPFKICRFCLIKFTQLGEKKNK